jgi:hypothetical protein
MSAALARFASLGLVLLVGLGLAGCGRESDTGAHPPEPAEVVAVQGSQVKEIVLTPKAAQRVGIEMAPVTAGPEGSVVPYSAVVYDDAGNTWVYTSPRPLTFVRTGITVARIAGDQAVLTAGPAVGTNVVTVGTAELFGTEQGIGQSSGH